MMKASSNCERETCSLCSKFIYKHQPVVVCSMDGNIYHGNCLSFCKDTCFHIQSSTIPDWMCPTCSREVFPCYDDIPDLSHVKCICYNCRLSRGESGPTLNFDPFNLNFDDNFNTFDDSMCDTLNCANTVLQSCSYYNPVNKGNVDDSLSKFYFNNIDGFKTNFNESIINIKLLNCIPSLIAFCETNLDEDDIHDFNMLDYNADHLYAIPGKKKGSGLSIYSHKTNLFRRISSLTIRNKCFECIGGSVQTEYKELSYIPAYISLQFLYAGRGFPDELKCARVTPLFKSGNRNLMSNYRPISILPTLSKIFEKLIHVRIYQFLEENQVLYSYQFGFRKAHSTVHAVQTAIHSVTKALDASYQCMGIFIDFSKAFDTIQHNILLEKLYHYGVRGVAHDLISSYHSNRKQFVYYDSECYSAVEDINVGVPQGSVLGPLFFILYVNDIISCAESSVEFILFADDTNIFTYAPTSEELYCKANKVLRQLNSYIDANYLHINLKKV